MEAVLPEGKEAISFAEIPLSTYGKPALEEQDNPMATKGGKQSSGVLHLLSQCHQKMRIKTGLPKKCQHSEAGK
jgi:hypothetical protein